MAPAASSRRAWIQCGFQRRLWLICSSTPARSQEAIIRSHSASDSAIGFSQMMARVAGAAAHSSTMVQCSSGWVATMHSSGRSRSSICR